MFLPLFLRSRLLPLVDNNSSSSNNNLTSQLDQILAPTLPILIITPALLIPLLVPAPVAAKQLYRPSFPPLSPLSLTNPFIPLNQSILQHPSSAHSSETLPFLRLGSIG